MTSIPSAQLPEGYTLHVGSPTVDDYLNIRANAGGLTPINEAQAQAALAGSWYCIHITHESEPSKSVAMGRIVGDGGWHFSIVDIAMLPEHQRKGIGQFVMGALMDRIREAAPKGPPGAYVTLFASEAGRGLYSRFGFKDTMPGNMGMAQWLEKS